MTGYPLEHGAEAPGSETILLLHGGSVATPQAAPVLPVPAELADSVKLVTIAAKPATMG